MNIPLSALPTSLLRLILCGGGGLPPAWGPLKHAGEDYETPWYPTFGAAIVSSDEGRGHLHAEPINEPDGWSIPLDAASPWPARLAMVAAWLVRADKQRIEGAGVVSDLGWLRWLRLYSLSDGLLYEQVWDLDDGGNIEPGGVRLDLPTLPHHLQTHQPTAALLLSLYDVPEIRARVESA